VTADQADIEANQTNPQLVAKYQEDETYQSNLAKQDAADVTNDNAGAANDQGLADDLENGEIDRLSLTVVGLEGKLRNLKDLISQDDADAQALLGQADKLSADSTAALEQAGKDLAQYDKVLGEYNTYQAITKADAAVMPKKKKKSSGGCHSFLGCLVKGMAKAGDVINALTEGVPPGGFEPSCDDEKDDDDDPAEGGGDSFTSDTLVLLADGKAVPIGRLKPGEKVLATNTKTGKTQPETVTAVLVHHDTDLYDLQVRDHGRTAVIDTTSSHLFWVPGASENGGRWVKAGALKYGTHLRSPDGSDTATVIGGWIPNQRVGSMWDLTIPGNNDHDFYVDIIAGSVLVHNLTNVYVPPPPRKILPGFPDATFIGNRGGRATWVDGKYILQWDYQHGAVEVYKNQTHLGEFDANTGKQTKDPVPGRTPSGCK